MGFHRRILYKKKVCGKLKKSSTWLKCSPAYTHCFGFKEIHYPPSRILPLDVKCNLCTTACTRLLSSSVNLMMIMSFNTMSYC